MDAQLEALPGHANMRLAVTTLTCEGKLLLNPFAVGIPEDRCGDSIEGAYQISGARAAETDDDAVLYTPGQGRIQTNRRLVLGRSARAGC